MIQPELKIATAIDTLLMTLIKFIKCIDRLIFFLEKNTLAI